MVLVEKDGPPGRGGGGTARIIMRVRTPPLFLHHYHSLLPGFAKTWAMRFGLPASAGPK
jgi:hypothetical protein